MQTARRALGAAALTLVLPLTSGCGVLEILNAAQSAPERPRIEISPRPDLAPYGDPIAPFPDPPPPSIEGPLPGWSPDENGVVLRVDLHDGYERSEIVSVDARGWVVRAADTSVMSSADDYTTWRLDYAGLRRILTLVDRAGVRVAEPGSFGDGRVSPYTRTVAYWFGDGRVLSATLAEPSERVSPRERRERRRLWDIAEALADPNWRGGAHLAASVRPWVPAEVAITARQPGSGSSASTYGSGYRPWPLPRSIRQLSGGLQPTTYGEPAHQFCLTGDDAAAVFALLDGSNHAYLGVDDGRRWELSVDVTLPAYELLSSPCA